MGWVIWAGVIPVCLVAAALLLRRPVRQAVEEVHFDQAREQFLRQREWLEARFLTALAKTDPLEAARWEDAQWHDEVIWARERPSRRLLALIGVHFEPDPVFDSPEESRHATALFEYHQGQWVASGRRLDETRPNEAFLRHQRFEPIVPHPRRVV